MPHRESKRPSRQALGRETRNTDMVAQSRPEVTRRDAAVRVKLIGIRAMRARSMSIALGRKMEPVAMVLR